MTHNVETFIYTVLPLATFFISVYLGAWMFYKGPRERLNRIFALLTAAIALWAIADVGIITAATSDIALAWARISGFGWIFIGAIFLHFVLVLTKRERILDNKLSYLALYGPGIFFLGMLWLTGEIYSEIHQTPLRFMTHPGSGFLVAMAYVGGATVLAIYLCIKSYRRFTGMEKAQVGLIGISALMSVSGGALTEVVLPLMNIHGYEVATILLLPTVIIFAIAIVKYRLLILPPITRFFIPIPEARFKTKLKFRLKESGNYLIKEKEPKRGPKIFIDQVTHDVPGLWLTTLRPNKVRERYGLARTPILCLSSEQIAGEVTMPPDKLDKVHGIISSYFFGGMPRKSVLFVNCLKELIVANGFERTMNFLKELVELCSRNNSNLIVQIDPSKFTNRQLVAIEKIITRS